MTALFRVLSAFGLAAVFGPIGVDAAQAGSATQPGQTVGLPVGAQLPVGLYFVETSNFGTRDTLPRSTGSGVSIPVLAWATPWTLLDGRLQFIASQPSVAASIRGAPYVGGFNQAFLAAQLSWNLGRGFGVSYLFGAHLPGQTRFLTQSASLGHRFALSYVGEGFDLTANLIYGTFLDDRSAAGTLYPDYINLDLTATKRFGRWEVGPVAFASTDLPTHALRYRPQGQVAVGGLVGYNFGPVNLQAYVTRYVTERNYGGYETRAWLRAIVPLYVERSEADPSRTLVAHRQAQ